MSSELVWQFIRKYTAFTKAGLHGERFTTEPGNLTGKHSYKYSGLVGKSLDLQAGEGNTLVLTKKTKATKKPAKSVKKVELKKRHPRQLKAVAAEAQNVRPDLKTAALRRASALHKAQVKKAATA